VSTAQLGCVEVISVSLCSAAYGLDQLLVNIYSVYPLLQKGTLAVACYIDAVYC